MASAVVGTMDPAVKIKSFTFTQLFCDLSGHLSSVGLSFPICNAWERGVDKFVRIAHLDLNIFHFSHHSLNLLKKDLSLRVLGEGLSNSYSN